LDCSHTHHAHWPADTMISATVGRIAQLHKRALLGRYSMPDTEKALALTEAVILGRLELLQPVHWLIKVAAVAARSTPQTWENVS
jgi:hypothetical protein